MNTYTRIKTIRLMERIAKAPEFADYIGVKAEIKDNTSVTYTTKNSDSITKKTPDKK